MSRSDIVKIRGVDRTPHRSLLKACGYTDEQIKKTVYRDRQFLQRRLCRDMRTST